MLVKQCAHVFQKLPGCALIEACALIRMNMVFGYFNVHLNSPNMEIYDVLLVTALHKFQKFYIISAGILRIK